MKKFKAFCLCVFCLSNYNNLISCSSNDSILISTSFQPERIDLLYSELSNQFPNKKIYIEYKNTSNLIGQLLFEGHNTMIDYIIGIDYTSTEIIRNKHPELFYNLSDIIDYSQYNSSLLSYVQHKDVGLFSKYSVSLIYNKKLVNSLNLQIPKSFFDLLNNEYENSIYIPNPKSSSTGYYFYYGIYEYFKCDLTKTVEYFNRLNSNIKEFTSSGSAPYKNVQRGLAPLGLTITNDIENAMINDKNLGIVHFSEGTPYTFETFIAINKRVKNNQDKVNIARYINNEIFLKDKYLFCPESIYKNKFDHINKNFDLNIKYLDEPNLNDIKLKKLLLDNWKF